MKKPSKVDSLIHKYLTNNYLVKKNTAINEYCVYFKDKIDKMVQGQDLKNELTIIFGVSIKESSSLIEDWASTLIDGNKTLEFYWWITKPSKMSEVINRIFLKN